MSFKHSLSLLKGLRRAGAAFRQILLKMYIRFQSLSDLIFDYLILSVVTGYIIAVFAREARLDLAKIVLDSPVFKRVELEVEFQLGVQPHFFLLCIAVCYIKYALL